MSNYKRLSVHFLQPPDLTHPNQRKKDIKHEPLYPSPPSLSPPFSLPPSPLPPQRGYDLGCSLLRGLGLGGFVGEFEERRLRLESCEWGVGGEVEGGGESEEREWHERWVEEEVGTIKSTQELATKYWQKREMRKKTEN